MRMLLATVLAAAAVAAPPMTKPATDVGATSATLHGSVDGPATDVHFEYGTTASGTYGNFTEPEELTAAGDVSATVEGLTGETEYHFRIVADGKLGNEQKFTTAANPLPPLISDQRARDVTIDSATASASVTANGTPTTYYVEWGTTRQYGSQSPTSSAGSGTSPTTVTAKMTDLKPYTVYHWRTVATNTAGITRGRDRTFRSARLPSGVTIGLSRSTVPWGGDVRLGGRVTGVGVGGMTVSLEQQRFPLDQDFTPLATASTGSDGGYLFTIPAIYTTTRYRVVTRTQVPVTSPVATARSAVKVGARARHVSRRWARVFGTVLPGVHGTASLQRYLRAVGWRQVKAKTVAPEDELRTRYSFSVRRPRKRAPVSRLRVVMLPVKGAHVRGTSRTVFVRPRF